MNSDEYSTLALTKAYIWAGIGCAMDRVFNLKGYYDDGRPFRSFKETVRHELAMKVTSR